MFDSSLLPLITFVRPDSRPTHVVDNTTVGDDDDDEWVV
jgi:hypothetical protein